MNQLNKYQLKKLINELKDLRSRHTELVSVYVPSGFNINVVRNQISQEQALASNIKSKATRKNVLIALDKALTELKYYKVTPPNGLVVFAGNVSLKKGLPSGGEELRSWSFEPPDKIQVRLYRTEPKFILDPLTEMIEPKYVYGLVVIDDKDAIFGVLKGKKITIIKESSSMVPGKTRAGGQSSRRFQRVREEIVKHWYKSMGDLCNELFGSYDNLTGLLIGGAGPAKEAFINSGHLGSFGSKVIAVQDVGHSGIVALEELVDKSGEALKREEVTVEKKVVNEFLEHLGKDDGLAVYGTEEAKTQLSNGLVRLLLISEKLDVDFAEELMKLAQQFGTESVMVSTDTREGEQLSQLGGVGAILRYKVS